jgi:hypothetical protein
MIPRIPTRVGDGVRSLTFGTDLPRLSCLLCLLTSVLGPLSSIAVQQAWIVKYNNGTNTINQPVGMGLDGEGNVYVAGSSTRPIAPYDFDYIVLKYSAGGTLLWSNRFGLVGVDEKISAVAVNTNGDVFVTGTSNTIKYVSSGLMAWTVPYPGRDIKVDAEGRIYVTGFRTDAYSTVKLAPAGTNLWLRLWDRSQWEDISQKVAVDNSGNVFIAGLATFACDRSGCYRHPWILKYDSEGNLLWSTLIVEGYYTDLSKYNGLVCDDQGHLHIAVKFHMAVIGSFPSFALKVKADGGPEWYDSWNNSHQDEGVLALSLGSDSKVCYTGIKEGRYESRKLTSSGTNVWESGYAPSAGAHRGNAIVADAMGNAYATGQSTGMGTGNDYATIKYGTNGQQLWVKRFTEAGNSDDQAHAIALGPNGEVYVTGFSNPTNGLYEITTIKYIQVSPIEKKSNGNILLTFCGAPGSNYVIEACSTLTNWTNIGSATANSSGIYTFEDTNAPLHRHRFYRTVTE